MGCADTCLRGEVWQINDLMAARRDPWTMTLLIDFILFRLHVLRQLPLFRPVSIDFLVTARRCKFASKDIDYYRHLLLLLIPRTDTPICRSTKAEG